MPGLAEGSGVTFPRRIAPPRPLAILLAIVAVLGVSWALAIPPWQSPDEVAHFAYAQTLADNGSLPGARHRPQESSDQVTADSAVGASRGAFYPQSSPPSWSPQVYRAYVATEHGAHRPSANDGGGANPAGPNPPFYYSFADVAYLIDHGGTAFGRLYAMQLWGVLLLLGSTVGAWLLAGETFGRRRIPQLTCAALVGLLPMDAFMSTSVNPDAMMITVWTLALWLGARVINHRARSPDAIALGLVTAAAILTKATSYALVIPVLLALTTGWWRHPADERRRQLMRIGTCLLALVLPVVAWLALTVALHRPAVNQVTATSAGPHPINIGQFLSYVWQFYLPHLSFLTRFLPSSGLPLYDVWLRQDIGAFGWLDVGLPSWVYPIATAIIAVFAIAAVGLFVRLRGRAAWPLAGFYALTALALLVLMHVTEYRSVIDGLGPVLQGRYLLPVVGLVGLTFAFVISRLPRGWRAPTCGAMITLLLVLQVLSLGAEMKAYYL